MSEKELIEQNLKNSPMIDMETGIAAVNQLAKTGKREVSNEGRRAAWRCTFTVLRV